MNLLAILYEADYRLVIERQDGACYLRVSRPGASITCADGSAYTLHIRAETLEAALNEAVEQIGKAEAVERHQ